MSGGKRQEDTENTGRTAPEQERRSVQDSAGGTGGGSGTGSTSGGNGAGSSDNANGLKGVAVDRRRSGAAPHVRFGASAKTTGGRAPESPAPVPTDSGAVPAGGAVPGAVSTDGAVPEAKPESASKPSPEAVPVEDTLPSRETVLKVEDINVYYGSIHALKGISFEVREGEIVTLIGANGAGKSTTLNTVAGLLRSRTGSVSFLGENLSRVPCHKIVSRGLALVPEGRRVFLQMTVRENLEMGAYTQPPAGIEADLNKVYHYFPRLKERERQIAGTLSGGEQQMLAMGRALMSHPKLLMLDEPSMGLAPILVEQIFEIIRTLHKAGATILLVEQNARAALSIADRGYVLETGRIVTAGRGRDLLESPEIKKAYLGG